MLKVIYSGGQDGVDIAALRAAKKCGFDTYGYIPKGYRTLSGFRPEYNELYNLQETTQINYKYRTAKNVEETDATIRIAETFNSPGEVCTLNAVVKFRKALLDVSLLKVNDKNLTYITYLQSKDIVEWLIKRGVVNLNIAGNTSKTSPGIEKFTENYLIELFNVYNVYIKTK